MSVPPPSAPNPFDDDAQRAARLDAQVDTSKRRRRVLLIGGGLVVLLAWGVLVLLGLAGTGLVLVPIGVFMILGSLLEL